MSEIEVERDFQLHIATNEEIEWVAFNSEDYLTFLMLNGIERKDREKIALTVTTDVLLENPAQAAYFEWPPSHEKLDKYEIFIRIGQYRFPDQAVGDYYASHDLIHESFHLFNYLRGRERVTRSFLGRLATGKNESKILSQREHDLVDKNTRTAFSKMPFVEKIIRYGFAELG